MPERATAGAVLAELERLGSTQTRKTYARHGIPVQQMYGVSFADLRALHKRIKTDHALAQALWDSGNADARHLATLIADPAAMTVKQYHAWAEELRYRLLAEMLAGSAAKSAGAETLVKRWTVSKDQWIGSAGYGVLAHLAIDGSPRPDAYFLERLEVIVGTIHGEKNFKRHAMYMALMAIGGRNEILWDAAKAAASRIGKVEVDHGDSSCKTPDAVPYMEKMWAHKRRKARIC